MYIITYFCVDEIVLLSVIFLENTIIKSKTIVLEGGGAVARSSNDDLLS